LQPRKQITTYAIGEQPQKQLFVRDYIKCFGKVNIDNSHTLYILNAQ